VAELETASGEVQRDVAASQGAWRAAAIGDRLDMGDGLRTGDKSVARLKLFPEGTAVVEPNTVMRFLSHAPGAANDRITLEEGTIELEATELDLEVQTARAVAKLPKGARVRVRAGEGADDAVRFDVLVGRVTVEHDGSSVDLNQGAELELKEKPSAAAPPPERAAEDAEPEAQGAAGGNGARTDFALQAPETATIHTPVLPVDVRVGLSACPEGQPSLDVTGPMGRNVLTPARGASHVVVRLSAGTYRLRMRCGKALAGGEGTLRVQRDAATMELPKTVPHVEVEADGRRYTVRYQNVLPAVTLAWPDAPAAASYSLLIQKNGRELRYQLKRPVQELRSGELGEGSYDFSFAASDGHHSAQGSLRIVFDNTARSAYLSSPAEGSVIQGNDVVVAGTALMRSDVSVDGLPVLLDAQGRFRIEVPAAEARDGLAVRVSHPITGVHYYLRRFR
jgi:hypothetical protein